MKKDITVPEVKNVHIVAINEWSSDFDANVWYVYLLNASDTVIEMPMVVSKAQGMVGNEERITSSLRHSYKEVAPFNAIRVEMMTTDVLVLENIFQVTYFSENQLFEKKFIFKANTINETNQVEIKSIMAKGIFAE